MTRFVSILAVAALLVGCGGSNSTANVSGNTRADSANVAAQATEPRTGDPTAAAPARPASTGATVAVGGAGTTAAPAGTSNANASPSTSTSTTGGEPTTAAAGPVALPSKISARHVLIQWMGSDRAGKSVLRTREQAMVLAQEVLKRAKGGDDLARLAVEYSDEPNAGTRGGSLGRFGKGQMVGAFEQVAFRLGVGEISDIVETGFGFHIIQRTE